MMRLMFLLIEAVLLSVCWAGPEAGQGGAQKAPAQETPTFKVQSNLVVVDATIRDKKGNLVRDLRREDFKVYEDDTAQEVVTFSFQDIPTGPSGTPPSIATHAVPAPIVNLSSIPAASRKKEVLEDKRLIILFFDLSSLKDEDLVRSLETAEDFASGKSGPQNLLAVATYSSVLQLQQDFTNDRELVLKALKRVNPLASDEPADASPAESESEEEQVEEVFVPDATQFNIFNTDQRLAALQSLAKAYREFPERKSLIYFSGGLSTTGVENQAQIRSTVDFANQANMTIYTVDSRGLAALPPGGSAAQSGPGGKALFSGKAVDGLFARQGASQETLTTLAHDTGGAAFQDESDLSPVFEKVQKDTQAYYVIGYYSTNPREDGRFRKIKIEMRRPDLRVQHRPGYYAPKQFARMTQGERDQQLEEALSAERPFTDLPFILQADYFRGAGSKSIVPLSLLVAGSGIQFEDKGERREAQFEFLARVTDLKGRLAGIARDTVDVRLPVRRAEKVRAGQIVYGTGFELRPGQFNLKFIMRDNRTGRLGSFERTIEVPALDGKALQSSSILLGSRLVAANENPQDIRHRESEKKPKGIEKVRDPLSFGEKRLVPSIGNVFLNRQTLYVCFEVYGAAEDPTTAKPLLETLLTLLQGKSRIREVQSFQTKSWVGKEKGTAAVAMGVPLRGLKRGQYILQIHVRDLVSDTNLFRRLPVVIN